MYQIYSILGRAREINLKVLLIDQFKTTKALVYSRVMS